MKAVKIFSFIATVLMSSSAIAGPIDSLIPSVVYVCGSSACGTGFLVVRDNEMFLVTAAHVAKVLTMESVTTIADEDGKPLTLPITALTGWKGKVDWKFHEISDVAVTRMMPNESTRRIIQKGHFIGVAELEVGKNMQSRDITFTVIGFASSLGTDGDFSPLSRDSHLASGIINDRQHGPLLLLQDPSVGGYSGAPVFDLAKPRLDERNLIVPGERIACIGVMSGTVSDDTGGKMAAVVPSQQVLELLRKF